MFILPVFVSLLSLAVAATIRELLRQICVQARVRNGSVNTIAHWGGCHFAASINCTLKNKTAVVSLQKGFYSSILPAIFFFFFFCSCVSEAVISEMERERKRERERKGWGGGGGGGGGGGEREM